jgi:hypothetical protein
LHDIRLLLLSLISQIEAPDASEIRVTGIGKLPRFDIRKDIPGSNSYPENPVHCSRKPEIKQEQDGEIQVYCKLRKVDGDISDLLEVFKLTENKKSPEVD